MLRPSGIEAKIKSCHINPKIMEFNILGKNTILSQVSGPMRFNQTLVLFAVRRVSVFKLNYLHSNSFIHLLILINLSHLVYLLVHLSPLKLFHQYIYTQFNSFWAAINIKRVNNL